MTTPILPQRILLINSGPAAADAIRAALADTGSDSFNVECVGQLSEGLERLGKKGIAAVLVALSLPDSTGIATFDRVALRRWVAHIHEVLEKFQDLLFALQNVESSYRGFILTGKQSFFEYYRFNISSAKLDQATVRSLTGDNPEQQRQLAAKTLLSLAVIPVYCRLRSRQPRARYERGGQGLSRETRR